MDNIFKVECDCCGMVRTYKSKAAAIKYAKIHLKDYRFCICCGNAYKVSVYVKRGIGIYEPIAEFEKY